MENIIISKISKNRFSVISTNFQDNGLNTKELCLIRKNKNVFETIRENYDKKITVYESNENIENLILETKITKEYLLKIEEKKSYDGFRFVYLDDDLFENIKDYAYVNYGYSDEKRFINKDFLVIKEEFEFIKDEVKEFVSNLKKIVSNFKQEVITNKDNYSRRTFLNLMDVCEDISKYKAIVDIISCVVTIRTSLSKNKEFQNFIKDELNIKALIKNMDEELIKYLFSHTGKFKDVFKDKFNNKMKEMEIIKEIKIKKPEISFNF